MEAIFRDGGKQYKVSEGTTVDLDYRPAERGATVEFGEVLFVGGGKDARAGAPLVDGARVVGTVVDQVRGPKLLVVKFRRRKNSRSRTGHRQPLTRVKIDKIEA